MFCSDDSRSTRGGQVQAGYTRRREQAEAKVHLSWSFSNLPRGDPFSAKFCKGIAECNVFPAGLLVVDCIISAALERVSQGLDSPC